MSTIRVRRANVTLDIRPDEKERYMEMGYSVIDEKGKVLEAALSNDVNALRTEVLKLRKELAEKDEEIAKKDEEIAELKSKVEKKTKKSE